MESTSATNADIAASGRRVVRLRDHRLLRRLPWRTTEREPVLEALGAAVVPAKVDIRALRVREGLSQRDFSRLYGLPYDSVRAWEGGTVPSQATRAFLTLIKEHPDIVRRALGVRA
jgi:DNA-binding transcriptional regulator YiaG